MVRKTRKGFSKEDSLLSSSVPEEESGFISRMRLCSDKIGSVNALARKSGISQSTVRRYLEGGEPGRPHLIALAKAAGVSLVWLATGEGDPEGEGYPEPPAPDMALLEEVIAKTERMLSARRASVKPEAKAKVIRLIYEYCLRQGHQMDEASMNNVIELAAYRAAG